jgi:hypothetical protein
VAKNISYCPNTIPSQKALNLNGYQNCFLIAGQIFRDGFSDKSGASIYYAV